MLVTSPHDSECSSVCNVIMTNLKRRMQQKRLQGLCTKIVNDAMGVVFKAQKSMESLYVIGSSTIR